jgi:hypothetical protein
MSLVERQRVALADKTKAKQAKQAKRKAAAGG